MSESVPTEWFSAPVAEGAGVEFTGEFKDVRWKPVAMLMYSKVDVRQHGLCLFKWQVMVILDEAVEKDSQAMNHRLP